MISAYEHMRFRLEQKMKFQIIGSEYLHNDFLIEVIEEQYTDLTPHSGNILYQLICLGLPETEIVFILSVFLYQVYKCIYCK